MCALGSRDAASERADFEGAVDYFSGDGGLDAQSFTDFFTMLSSAYPEEDEFKLMTTTAFGIHGASIGGCSGSAWGGGCGSEAAPLQCDRKLGPKFGRRRPRGAQSRVGRGSVPPASLDVAEENLEVSRLRTVPIGSAPSNCASSAAPSELCEVVRTRKFRCS